MAQQFIYIVRIMAAGICGIAIGCERESRAKVAGIRTHFLIALAASVMTIISKYGFTDTLDIPGESVDVSRVAAGILAGAGLMSGGLVIMGKQGYISGVTTAAGIWATVAIGMAIGAGMYGVGGITTVIILLGQYIMHRRWNFTHYSWRGQIEFIVNKPDYEEKNIFEKFNEIGIEIDRIHVDCEKDDKYKIKIQFSITTIMDRNEMSSTIQNLPNVVSYEF